MKNFMLLILVCMLAKTGFSQDIPAYEKKVFGSGADTLPFRILYPLGYDARKKYPLIVFLHGSGERGNNNIAQLTWGGSLFADSANRKKFPAIVIFPQCPWRDGWAMLKRAPVKDSLGGLAFYTTGPPSKALNNVMQLLDSMAATGTVNTRKMYVGGLSMGGMGTFEILWRKPGFFAAALPICGGGAPEQVALYAKNFPVWIFHGDKDPAVAVGNSRLMANALKAAGAKVKYSEYAGVQHDSWKNAFAEPDLLKWLFAQKRKK